MSNEYPKGSLEHRFAALIEIDPLSGCHIWHGPRTRNGYAVISLRGRRHLVHRLRWTLRYGTIRNGLELCHRCDEPRCVNPDHHFIGTHQANMADRRDKHRARIERALADLDGERERLLAIDELPGGELSRMRLYIRGVEITGRVRIRPFNPGQLANPKRRAIQRNDGRVSPGRAAALANPGTSRCRSAERCAIRGRRTPRRATAPPGRGRRAP